MRQASGNFPFHRGTGTCVIPCPFGKQGQHDSPHLHTFASCSPFCLVFQHLELVQPALQPLPQILFLARCHLLPHLSVGKRVSPSPGKDPTCQRDRFCPVPSPCRVIPSPLLLKTWQPSSARSQRSFAVEPSNSLVKYQAVIRLVQTLLRLGWPLVWDVADEPESKDLTCFVGWFVFFF